MNQEAFDLLVARHLERSLDAAGRRELAAILRDDPQRRAEYLRLLEQEGAIREHLREQLTPSARHELRVPRRPARRRAARRWPLALAAGLLLAIGALTVALLQPPSVDGPIFAASLHGSASVERDGQAVKPALLRPGDRIRADGTARLAFATGGAAALSPGTSVELVHDGHAAEGVLLRLRTGSLTCDLPQQPHGFTIATSEAEAAVLGTRFSVTASAGRSAIAVEHGRVAVRAAGRRMVLPAGASAEATTADLRGDGIPDEAPARLDDASAWRQAGELALLACGPGRAELAGAIPLADVWSARSWRWSAPLPTAEAWELGHAIDTRLTGIWHTEVFLAEPGTAYDQEGQPHRYLRLALREHVPLLTRSDGGTEQRLDLWRGPSLVPGRHTLRLQVRTGTVIAILDGAEVWRGAAPWPRVEAGVRFGRRSSAVESAVIEQVSLRPLDP